MLHLVACVPLPTRQRMCVGVWQHVAPVSVCVGVSPVHPPLQTSQAFVTLSYKRTCLPAIYKNAVTALHLETAGQTQG